LSYSTLFRSLGRPRRPWRALAIDPAGRSLLHQPGQERAGVGAGDRLLEVGDLAREEAEVRARQQTLRRGRERRVETVRDAFGAQAAALRPRRLGIQAPARLDPGEELAGGEPALEDPPLREHAAVEHRRHALESPARPPAD